MSVHENDVQNLAMLSVPALLLSHSKHRGNNDQIVNTSIQINCTSIIQEFIRYFTKTVTQTCGVDMQEPPTKLVLKLQPLSNHFLRSECALKLCQR